MLSGASARDTVARFVESPYGLAGTVTAIKNRYFGGNVDVTTLSRVITRGLTYGGRLATITTKLADRAGSLANLLNVVGGTGANVVRIHHEREDVNSEVNACVVSMVLETRNADHVQKIKDELTAKGYSLLEA